MAADYLESIVRLARVSAPYVTLGTVGSLVLWNHYVKRKTIGLLREGHDKKEVKELMSNPITIRSSKELNSKGGAAEPAFAILKKFAYWIGKLGYWSGCDAYEAERSYEANRDGWDLNKLSERRGQGRGKSRS